MTFADEASAPPVTKKVRNHPPSAVRRALAAQADPTRLTAARKPKSKGTRQPKPKASSLRTASKTTVTARKRHK